uniref:ceruloplasmin isoform X2 n=1 Tax=Pristiophorus japonicus TaxID=55135 RepID=UPI00398F15E9
MPQTQMLPFASRRSPVVCTGGCTASSQPLATGAGLDILKKGGNAADAAVAMAAVLNLTEPFSTGLGGDCNCLFYDAKTKNVHGLNGSGRSPQALTLDLLKKQGFVETNPLPLSHANLVTVPGAAAGWCDAVSLFGSKKLSLGEILQPAIELAERGYAVAEITAFHWEKGASVLQSPGNQHGKDLLIQGKSPKYGQIFKNPLLAQTFKELAQIGKKGFYEGRIAGAIVDVIQKNGGVMNLDDLKEHTSTEVSPIFTDYKGVRIWELPPNGQGITALMAFNMLENFNIKEMGHNSADYIHLLAEALKLSFVDTFWFCADPAKVKVPVEELLTKPYCKQRSELINIRRTNNRCLHGSPCEAGGDTVYFTAVDAEGSACSFINSNCLSFGTGLVPGGCGFALQNRGSNFSLSPQHPNCLAPGKRPYHTIIPALATSAASGQLLCSFGVMGGFMQPQGHVQVLLNMLEFGMNPQEALDAPRFCVEHKKSDNFADRGVHWPRTMIAVGTGTVESFAMHASVFLKRSPTRIGSVYKKAVYLEYTSDNYTKEIAKPEWLGFLGPIIKAEQGDTIIVHLKNFASRPYSLHPHGVTYTKANEGALYPDNSTFQEKLDDSINPGTNYTYMWVLTEDQSPADGDIDCLTRAYHSHIDAPRDTATGLVGPFIICKKGVLTGKKKHGKEADEEFALMFSVMDENLSWYLEDNIRRYCTTPSKVDTGDEDFMESNKMHSINGYVYGNLPHLSMFTGDKVVWYLFGMGNEVDIHSVYFHGQILIDRHLHVDTISLFPATFVTAVMVPKNQGTWLLSCQVNDHVEAGMQALFEVVDYEKNAKKAKSKGNERRYYIAADEIIWNYGPSGVDQFTGKPLESQHGDAVVFFERGETRIGGIYKKAVYREYTDDTFKKQKERTPNELHMGILGPVIKAEVGDRIKVTFWNNASQTYSIQPHGVSYGKTVEGAKYQTNRLEFVGPPVRSPHVNPGYTFIYEWNIPEDFGPGRNEPDCLTYLYYSTVDSIKDTSSGLVGPLIVCKKNTLNSQGKQKNVDKEFYLLATVFDENLSWYLDDNIKMFATKPKAVDKEDEDFQESNKMHSINGYMYGNQPGLVMDKGNRVSWHLIGLGSEVDIHGIYFQGNTFLNKGTRRDTANLFPHISLTAIMEPDSSGKFEVACKTTDHYAGGMKQFYTVNKCSIFHFLDIFYHVKTYYIAAVEIEWDYSPSRAWELERHRLHKDSPGEPYVVQGNLTIGSKYKKVVYREYTDMTFTKQKARTAKEKHLEIQGPLLHATVNDKLKIVFKNLASRPYSIHAHGVKTDSPAVKYTLPGETETYIWKIPDRSGPEDGESRCIPWMYYSTIDPIKDMYSGLIGTLVICRKNLLTSIGLKKKHELQEFALLFLVCDENESWYLDENIKNYCFTPKKVDKTDEDFIESNKMHAINGKLYGNLHGLDMFVDEKVFWYLTAMGNEVDIHTAHFHGHSFEYKMGGVHRGDVYDLFPGTFQTVEMSPQHPGTWLLHCHVTDHIYGGMETNYTVHVKPGKETLPGLIIIIIIGSPSESRKTCFHS